MNISIATKKIVAVFCLLVGISAFSFSQADSLVETEPYTIEPTVVNGPLDCISAPNKFEVSDQFNGYIRKDVSSTILISEIEGINYIQMTEGYSKSFIENQEMTLVEQKDFVSTNNIKGTLYKVRFDVKDVPVTRFILFAGKLDKTIWINISYPTKFEDLLDSVFEETLQTLKL